MPRTNVRLPLDFERGLSAPVGLILLFGAVARGAHDLWAATAVYLCILALPVLLVGHAAWRGSQRGLPGSVLPYLGGLATALTLSFIGSIHPAESYIRWLDWMAAMALFWSSLRIFRSPQSVEVLLLIVAPAVWIQMITVLLQQVQGPFFTGEPGGTLVNANAAAAFLLLWLPVFTDKALRSWRSREPLRVYWAAVLGANVVAFLFVYSTWGIISLLVCAPLFAPPGKVQTLVRRSPRAAAACASVLLTLITLMLWHKFHRTTDLAGHPLAPGETMRRLAWWASGARMLWDHPWIGVGLGNYPSAYLAYQSGAGQHTLFAHSFPVSMMAETGLLGAVSLLTLLLCGARRLEVRTERRPFLVGLILLLVFTSANVGMEFLVILLGGWLFAALLAAPGAEDGRRPGKLPSIAFTALALCAVPYIAAPFFSSRNCVEAEARLRTGDTQGALRAYCAAAGIDPLSSEAERGWARALFVRYSETGNPSLLAESVRHHRKAASLNHLQGVLWWELGSVLRHMGKKEEALDTIQYAASLDQGHPVIRRDLFQLREESRAPASSPGHEAESAGPPPSPRR